MKSTIPSDARWQAYLNWLAEHDSVRKAGRTAILQMLHAIKAHKVMVLGGSIFCPLQILPELEEDSQYQVGHLFSLGCRGPETAHLRGTYHKVMARFNENPFEDPASPFLERADTVVLPFSLDTISPRQQVELLARLGRSGISYLIINGYYLRQGVVSYVDDPGTDTLDPAVQREIEALMTERLQQNASDLRANDVWQAWHGEFQYARTQGGSAHLRAIADGKAEQFETLTSLERRLAEANYGLRAINSLGDSSWARCCVFKLRAA